MISQEELGARLRRAREHAGLTQQEAGHALGMDDTTIAKMERCRRGVGALELGRLASVYGISIEEMLEDPLAKGEVPLTIAMRAEASSLGPRAEAMKRRLQQIVADDRWLREGGGEKAEGTTFVELGISEDGDDLERGYRGAKIFRERYGLGRSPIADVSIIADEVGVVVARMPLGNDGSPDGCSAVDPETGAAYVLVNSDKPRMRRRFTIAHELGHLSLGHLHGGEVVIDETVGGKSPCEREANAFAAGLLMPDEGVRGALRRLMDRLGASPEPVDWIVWLAASFGVSEQAAAYRLANLQLIQSVGGNTAEAVQEMAETYGRLREARARLGLSPVMSDIERGVTEVGPAMRARIVRALSEGAISVDGAAEMLHQSPEDIYRWVASSHIHLGEVEAPL